MPILANMTGNRYLCKSETALQVMKKSIYFTAAALASLLSACGDTQIEHCTNEYDPVEKGNVDALNADKREVVSEIPEAGIADQVIEETRREEAQTDSLGTPVTEVDENGEVVLPEEGAQATPSEQVEKEEMKRIEESNRRTGDKALRDQRKREEEALKAM